MDILPISFGGQPDLLRAVPLVVLRVLFHTVKSAYFYISKKYLRTEA